MNYLKFFFLVSCCFLGLSTQKIHANPIAKIPSLSYWDVDYTTGWKMQFTLTVDGEKFVLKTRKNSVKEALSKLDYRMAKTAGMVSSSELVTISGVISYVGDTIVLQGRYDSPVRKQDFKGRIVNDQFQGTLANGVQMNGNKVTTLSPRRDYISLVDSIMSKTGSYIYNPELLNTKQFIEFKTQMERVGRAAHDDCEFEYLFNWYSAKLPFSHYSVRLYKMNSSSLGNSGDVTQSLSEINESSALLTINSFGGKKSDMDSIVNVLQHKNYQNLIIDLRKNGGGNLFPALSLGKYLVSEPLYYGIFLTRNYFEKYKQLPSVEKYTQFPQLSEENAMSMLSSIDKYEGICLKVNPDKNSFKGKIYVLTSKGTASACEPFVYGLKYTKRATIVGEKTAGQMLSARSFFITEDCLLTIPILDYYAMDGQHLDKVGVTPDVKVDKEKALDYVKQLLAK